MHEREMIETEITCRYKKFEHLPIRISINTN